MTRRILPSKDAAKPFAQQMEEQYAKDVAYMTAFIVKGNFKIVPRETCEILLREYKCQYNRYRNQQGKEIE